MDRTSRLKHTSAEIGKRLHAARARAGITLSQLASRTQLSEGFLSRLERGQASSSIANLLRITESLAIGLHELFTRDESVEKTSVAVHRVADADLQVTSVGYRWRPLAGGAALDHMEIFHIVLPPREHMRTMVAHPGQEHCYVISGEIHFYVGEQKHHLRAGDGILIDSELPHRAESAGGREAHILMAVSKAPHSAAPVDWWRLPLQRAAAISKQPPHSEESP